MSKIVTPGSGTEFEGWAETWCNRCLHDHDQHEGQESHGGCVIVMRAMLADDNRAPTVWQHYWWWTVNGEPRTGVRCAGFEPCEPCGVPVDLRPPIYGETPSMSFPSVLGAG